MLNVRFTLFHIIYIRNQQNPLITRIWIWVLIQTTLFVHIRIYARGTAGQSSWQSIVTLGNIHIYVHLDTFSTFCLVITTRQFFKYRNFSILLMNWICKRLIVKYVIYMDLFFSNKKICRKQP